MDINEIDVVGRANEGFSFNLLHPGTGEETDIVIHCLGFDSEKVFEAERLASKNLAKQNRDNLPDALEAVKMAKVKACIVRIENLEDGETKIETPDQLAPYLEKPIGRAIVEQVQARARDRANLFPKPPTD